MSWLAIALPAVNVYPLIPPRGEGWEWETAEVGECFPLSSTWPRLSFPVMSRVVHCGVRTVKVKVGRPGGRGHWLAGAAWLRVRVPLEQVIDIVTTSHKPELTLPCLVWLKSEILNFNVFIVFTLQVDSTENFCQTSPFLCHQDLFLWI